MVIYPVDSIIQLSNNRGLYINFYYYSFKIFLRFWLAFNHRLIPANRLSPTKFGQLSNNWKIIGRYDVNRPITEKLLDDWRHATTRKA